MFARWSKVLGILPLVGALAGLAGCAGNGSASTDAAGTPVHAEQAEHAGHMRHGHGPAALLGIAIHELDLTDAQKTTLKAELDAIKPSAEARATHEASRKAVADAVRSGKVDEASLLSQMTMPKPDRTRLAQAMKVLHDTLTPAQRKELADSVNAKLEKWSGKMGEEKAGHGDHPHGPMMHMLKGLDLSDQQKTDVKAALEKLAPSEADREAMKTRFETFRTTVRERMVSFQADPFDATAFVAVPADAPKPAEQMMAEHMVKAVAAITPILNETQRAELAKRIEAGPAALHGDKGDEE